MWTKTQGYLLKLKLVYKHILKALHKIPKLNISGKNSKMSIAAQKFLSETAKLYVGGKYVKM